VALDYVAFIHAHAQTRFKLRKLNVEAKRLPPKQLHISPATDQTKKLRKPNRKFRQRNPNKNCASPTPSKIVNHMRELIKIFPPPPLKQKKLRKPNRKPRAQLQQKTRKPNVEKKVNHASSTKHFPHRHSNKKLQKP
jgi:hypothetical protein